jgi:hypothetical protein
MRVFIEDRSVVAIDPTKEGIAYAFFESGELMDSGERFAARDEGSQLAVVDELLDGCAADILVLEDPDAPNSRRRSRVSTLLRTIARHARRRGISVRSVAREDVRAAWKARGLSTKEAVAAEIAAKLPDLLPLLPPKRKLTVSEDRRVNIFDAVSLALYVFDPARLGP